MDLENIIYKFAYNRDIIIGICDANRLDYLDNVDISAPFVHFSKEERINPMLTMPCAKSIIVAGVGNRKKEIFDMDDEVRGIFSLGASGLDYHIHIKSILHELEMHLKQYKDFESKIFADTGSLIEREFAKKAGVGWQGKSGNLISGRFGTFFNIGYMLVDFKLETSVPFSHDYTKCGDCEACIKACPAHALTEDSFDYRKCISYLTQIKEPLTSAQMQTMGLNLYGCDICQNACKFNEDKYCGGVIDDIETIRPNIKDIVKLTNREFDKKYSKTAIGWRGKNVLKRNAIIALVNSGGKRASEGYNLSGLEENRIIKCASEYNNITIN